MAAYALRATFSRQSAVGWNAPLYLSGNSTAAAKTSYGNDHRRIRARASPVCVITFGKPDKAGSR